MFRMKSFLLAILVILSLKSFGVVHANFGANRFNGCPPLLSTFTNTSTFTPTVPNDSLSYYWDFANGNTSRQANPSAIFNTTGTYRVKLVVTSLGGESDSITRSVRVFRLPQADFVANVTNICFGDTLFLNSNITLGDAPITDYAWGFGNGIASSANTTSYVYTQTGLYDITLVIQDSNHCSVSIIKPQYVNVVNKPQAAFTASPATSCATSQAVSFTSSSAGNGLTYFWQLAAGATSTAANPSYTYSNQTQSVRLTVTDMYGCTNSVSHSVTVRQLVADFFASNTEPCTGQPVHFTNGSNLSGNAVWDFGDGTTSTASDPDHIYNATGVYTVKLIESFGSCTDTKIKNAYITVKQGVIPSFAVNAPSGGCNDSISVSFSNTTAGSGLQFNWNFGDGLGSSASNPNHAYSGNGNYQVVLTVTAPNGCESQVSNTVPINSYLPIPSFSADTAACLGGTVLFRNTSTSSAQINWGAYSWLWTFGDGDSSTASTTSHEYLQAGVYDVSLRIVNSLGCDTTISKKSYIHVDTVGLDFGVNQTFSPCPPFVSIFNSTCTKTDVEYVWDFGDGNTDTAANPTHIYFHPGIFDVSCTVTTSRGCPKTTTYPHLIEVQGPYGVFGATPTTGCAPLTTVFTASVSANTKNMWCDMGDGTIVSDTLAFNYTYTHLGVYNPKFILVDHVGCTVPYDLPPVITHAAPPLNLFDTAICTAATINVGLDSGNYHWSPSTYLSCDTCNVLTISPAASINYVVTSSNQYCTLTDTMHVIVETLPVLNSYATTVCPNTPVLLNAGMGSTITWSPATYLNDSLTASPVSTPQDSIVYTVVAGNSLGCTSTAQVTVNVIDKLEINPIADLAICYQDSFQLAATLLDSVDAEVSYTWTPANYLVGANTNAPTGHGLGTTTKFKVIAASGTCAADTATVNVVVNALPKLKASEDFTTTPNAEVQIYASSASDLTYTWKAVDSISCTDCRRTTIYPTQSQTIYVNGVDEYGCKASDSIKVQVVACDPETIFLPNVFTPNADGLNDELFMSSKTLATLNYFRIFDEWGRMVYETKNMNDKWDGKVNGQPVSIDVFAYVLEGKCQNGSPVLKYGNISVVR